MVMMTTTKAFKLTAPHFVKKLFTYREPLGNSTDVELKEIVVLGCPLLLFLIVFNFSQHFNCNLVLIIE